MHLQSEAQTDGVVDAGASAPATIAQLASGVFVLDSLITKGLSIHGQTRAIEDKLAKLLRNSFTKTIKSALAKACYEIQTGPKAHAGHAIATLSAACVAWAKVIGPLVSAATAEAYRAGKVYAYQRAYGHVAHIKKVLPPGVKIPLPKTGPKTPDQYWLPNGAGVFDWRPATFNPPQGSLGWKIGKHMSEHEIAIDAYAWNGAGGTPWGLYKMMDEGGASHWFTAPPIQHHPPPTKPSIAAPPSPHAASVLTTPPGAPPPVKPKGKGGPKPGGKMAEVKPSFTLVDKQAVEAASKIQTLWIGNYASMDIAQAIAKVASDVIITAGYDRAVAAATLHDALSSKFGFVEEAPTLPAGHAAPPSVPTKWNGTAMDYLGMVASNAANQARNYGQLNGFKELKITTYTIVNPLDERTCTICEMMDGKVMETSLALDQMDDELKSVDPDQMKFTHPWVHSAKEALAISGAKGDGSTAADNKKLSDAGFSYPPYHGRCRCTVDITEDFEPSFEPVTVEEEAAAAPPEPEFIELTDPLIAVPPIVPVSLPDPAPPPPAPQESDEFPWTVGQMKALPDKLNGMHSKSVFESPDGEKWMYKPQPEFRAMVDKLAADLAKLSGRPTAEVHMWNPGKYSTTHAGGSIQRLFKGVSGDLMDHPPIGLAGSQLKEIQKEHIFDWFISQHDTHGGNIIKTKDGLKFIDKGQAFRFLGKDALDLNFGKPGHPNPSGTYYQEMFSQYAQGKAIPLAKLTELSDVVKSIKSIPDEVLAAKLRPYARAALDAASESASMKAASWMGKFNEQQFIDFMIARKNNIEKEVERFYKELESARAKSLGVAEPKQAPVPEKAPKKPKVPRAAPKDAPLTQQEWAEHVQVAKAVGWKGRSVFVKGPDFENGNWNLYGVDNDGSFMDAKVRASGDAKLRSFLKGLKPDTQPVTDPTYEKLVTVVKSYNHHLKASGDGAMPPQHEETVKHLYDLFKIKAESKYKGNDLAMKKEIEEAKHYMEFMKHMWQPPSKPGEKGAWQLGGIGKKLERYVGPKPKTAANNGLPPGWSVEKVEKSDPIARSLVNGRIQDIKNKYSRIDEAKDRTVYKLTTPSGDHVYYNPHTNNTYAAQGSIRIHFGQPLDKLTPQELDKRFGHLAELGLEVKKADAKDLELIWLRKVAYKERIDGHVGGISESLPTEEQIKKLEQFFLDHGLKLPGPSKRVPEVNADGGAWGKWYSSHLDAAAKGLVIKHEVYGDTVAGIIQIIKGGAHELVATMEKSRAGINISGSSPDSDMTTGGASYVFGRIRLAGKYTFDGLYFKSKALTDLDAVSYHGDEYGNVKPETLQRRMTHKDWKAVAEKGYGSGDETIFKHGLSFDLLDKIVVPDQTGRNAVLQALRDKGIKEFGGTPIEELVIVKQPKY